MRSKYPTTLHRIQNPFVNLRKYARDTVDPNRSQADRQEAKENLATETLAACLQFSPAIKQSFVQFLFRNAKLPLNTAQCADLVVTTQVNIEPFGILDLHFALPESVDIAVEVKVGAPEGEVQLRDYRNWLN